MASKLLSLSASRRLFVGGAAAIAAAAYTTRSLKTVGNDGAHTPKTPAEIQFHTSFGYSPGGGADLIVPPKGWTGPTFEIRNDYPTSAGPGASDAPWLAIDFRAEPERYARAVRDYCFEGNVDAGFVVQKNKVRDWYHAAWMHWNKNGREPLHGLTFERVTPPYEFSSTQPTYLQTWACGYYNAAGASAFGKIWKNPNAPDWKSFRFPKGSAVFKILMSDATDDEIPSMVGSPGMQAVIAYQPDRTKEIDDATKRNDFPTTLRLLQVDIAVQDDRAPIGWVFATFMYDGSQKDANPWHRAIPVGIQWGNDPELTQTQADKGEKPVETWINPKADALRKRLGGTRPSWGWNGRLNGPADNFRSACASCHSTAEWSTNPNIPVSPMVSTAGSPDAWVMRWFRNIKAGQPFDNFDPYAQSGDYSLQLMIGFANYQAWAAAQNSSFLYRGMVRVGLGRPAKEMAYIEKKRAMTRAG